MRIFARSMSGPSPGAVVSQSLLRGETLGEAAISMPGRFNILNALAALAVGLELDIPFDVPRVGL